MQTTTVVIIGAGQAGLAMSRCLTDRSIDHVLLERAVTAHSWRTERWDSLRLLTPELAEPAPRLGLSGRRSGRLHDGRRGRPLSR